MGALTVIEDAYLAVLRVAILVLATVLLVLAVLGAAKGLPLLLPQKAEAGDTSLRAFVAEQGVVEGQAEDPDLITETAVFLPADLQSASAELGRYSRTRMVEPVDQPSLDSYLAERYEQLEDSHRDGYVASLKKLATDLNRSKGKPLTLSTFNDLLIWHHGTYAASANARDAEKEAKKATAFMSLTVSGGLFLSFLLIVFCFIGVKIERNLRHLSLLRPRAQ